MVGTAIQRSSARIGLGHAVLQHAQMFVHYAVGVVGHGNGCCCAGCWHARITLRAVRICLSTGGFPSDAAVARSLQRHDRLVAEIKHSRVERVLPFWFSPIRWPCESLVHDDIVDIKVCEMDGWFSVELRESPCLCLTFKRQGFHE